MASTFPTVLARQFRNIFNYSFRLRYDAKILNKEVHKTVFIFMSISHSTNLV